MNIQLRKGRLGIMVTERNRIPPFSDQRFYRHLSIIGNQCGLNVIVFSPDHIHWHTASIVGYIYKPQLNRWQKVMCPLPDLIYDRCFFTDKRAYLAYRAQVRQLTKRKRIKFLGHGLRGKWHVTQLLSTDELIAPYLPPTEKMLGQVTMKHWFHDHKELFLKPQGGSHGKGVLYIKELTGGNYRYFVKGRDHTNKLFQKGFYEFSGRGTVLRIHPFPDPMK